MSPLISECEMQGLDASYWASLLTLHKQ